jgi:hypothetical protein
MQPPRRVVWRTGDLTSAMGAQSSHPRNVLLGASGNHQLFQQV